MSADLVALGGLFLAAFLAASLLPAQSEAVLVGLYLSGVSTAWLLWAVASLGNVGGSVLNWAMGRVALRYQDHRLFPVKAHHMARARAWYQRWGYFGLLASWVPIIGDPITLGAGLMGERFWRFVLLVSIAKSARYGALIWAAGHLAG